MGYIGALQYFIPALIVVFVVCKCIGLFDDIETN